MPWGNSGVENSLVEPERSSIRQLGWVRVGLAAFGVIEAAWAVQLHALQRANGTLTGMLGTALPPDGLVP